MKNTNSISLHEHMNASIKQNEPVNESLILGALICTACVSYSLKGVLETDFMKSIGSGIGGLLGGLGSMFAGGSNAVKQTPSDKELTELRGLLKRKPGDLTPKERERINELSSKYDVESELSENDLKKLNAITNDNSDDNDDEPREPKTKKEKTGEDDEGDSKPSTPEKFTKDHLSSLLMLAKSERDKLDAKNRNKEDDAMFDLLVACSYDKDGKLVEIDAMKEKMKDIVGEDQWEAFSAKVDESYNKVKDSDEFIDALSKFEKELRTQDPEKRDERIEAFQSEAKEHAKATMQKIEERKSEQQRIENEIAEVEEKLNNTDEDDEDGKNELKTKLDKLKTDLDKTKSPIEGLLNNPDKPEEGEKDADEYTNKDIDKIQDELSELDPEKPEDKEKIKEKEKILKAVAKAKGKDESEFLPKVEMVGDGDNKKPVQKKVGPRGAKYFRTKGDNGWGEWRWYKSESDITVESNNVTYSQLQQYLLEQLK